jgi:hypothetical protein
MVLLWTSTEPSEMVLMKSCTSFPVVSCPRACLSCTYFSTSASWSGVNFPFLPRFFRRSANASRVMSFFSQRRIVTRETWYRSAKAVWVSLGSCSRSSRSDLMV